MDFMTAKYILFKYFNDILIKKYHCFFKYYKEDHCSRRIAIFRDAMIPLIRGAVLFKILVFSHLELKGIKVYTDNIQDQIMMDVEILYVILYFFFVK